MESYDCAEDEEVIECSDSDGDCISDDDDENSSESSREQSGDSDLDGVPDDEDQCPGEDDRRDEDYSGTPDCLEDFF